MDDQRPDRERRRLITRNVVILSTTVIAWFLAFGALVNAGRYGDGDSEQWAAAGLWGLCTMAAMFFTLLSLLIGFERRPFSIVPWLPGRFSLRSLLVTMTLVAIALGLIVLMVRK